MMTIAELAAKKANVLTASRLTFYRLTGPAHGTEKKPSPKAAATNRLDLVPYGTKFRVVAYATQGKEGKIVWHNFNGQTRICEDTLKGYWTKEMVQKELRKPRNQRRAIPPLKLDLWIEGKPSKENEKINTRSVKIEIISLPKKN